MQLSEKLYGAERNFFVGRRKEIEMFKRHAAGNSDWQWLHIYGPSGIGKSTLLQQFMSEFEAAHIYIIDGSKTIRVKEDVLVQLTVQLQGSCELNLSELSQEEIVKRLIVRSQQKSCNIVLLLDALEKWHSVEEWLPNWLGQFEDTVRIITAGRFPLTGGWLRSGWVSLIDTLELPSLTQMEVNRYAQKRGLISSDTNSLLFQFSRGIPLAMTIAAEMMLKGNQNKPLAKAERNQLIAVLMEELLDGLPSLVRRIFEAASVFWRFNEERLASIINEEIDQESFRKLTSMPFVNLKEDGWMLHDAVRSWSLEDMMLRKPQTYEQMRRNALKQIRKEELSNPLYRQKLNLDKLSLHENPFVRNLCFSGNLDDFEVRDCRECDLHTIVSLFKRYHQYKLPSSPQDFHMEHLIRPIWEVDPTTFITIWKENEIVAAFGKVPLNTEMLHVLASERLLHPFIKSWKQTSNAYLLSFIGIEPELEEEIRSCVTNTIINHTAKSEWILDFTCINEWFPVLEWCGFERASWADATTDSGTEFRAFILDLTKEDYFSKLDRLLSKRSIGESAPEHNTAYNIQLLKAILKGYSNLLRNHELAETYTCLFPHRIVMDHSIIELGNLVQKDLIAAINFLSDNEELDGLSGKLLKCTYIQGVRPQQLVAERFSLSMATYYRYLNKAIDDLYQVLDKDLNQ
ncbi:AAA family ATPase [Bacillus sp. ISL-47]|uniref:ATP-binding protein n=1 Tax=Bacillus sp. ISL-47 TaxID=2819130 RepID=UPI001BEBCAC5|nr:AAA family ATPase [Bacillus sp. ISL-47]MBT2689433.1 AAA family ATPase [Bacillus sp. ISL-47]MBT2709844.1 AAA family ATPase [Pseudomonas sp. ISL-84]